MTKLIILLLLIALGIWLFNKFFKIPKIGSLALVTGGVKSGKSTLSVHFVLRKYKQIKRNVAINNFFRKIFKRELLEIPLLYSNVPLGIPYVEIDRDLLLRNKRFRYNSVVYIQEASLVADSQLIKNNDINNNLLLFNKLIAHSGVYALIYDTQSISDVHYSIKRSLSNYFYIHHLIKLPLIPFLVCYILEYRYSDDGSVIAITGDKDLEECLKRVIIPKTVWKKFDSKCFSPLTDDLPIKDDVITTKNLKCDKIISFRKEFEKMSNTKNLNKKFDNQVSLFKEKIKEKEKKFNA